MKRLAILLMAAMCLISCNSKKTIKALLPNVSGKAGEVLVVIEKEKWDGDLGDAIRGLLADECPWLAQSEPLYTLVNVAPGGFADLFKVHRNIVIVNVDPQASKEGVAISNDVWAAPQIVLQISAFTDEGAAKVVADEAQLMTSALEQAERDRVIRNTMLYEERELYTQASSIFGGAPHFPTGYKLKKATEDFIWIADERQYTNQSIVMYRYPATGDPQKDLSEDAIRAHRNEVMMYNIPGMFENTYVTTSEIGAFTTESIRYQGRAFVQTRGFWEVENDFMGGPFVSHSQYSQDGSEVIVCEAFVYAPRFDKRQYLRQVESLLYSFEWKNK
ncbi:MAG: DUF4837 family protein [Bacteroidales bacterium]|nr:DUF4837 family protein [Bacteroidales bacterium]